MLIFLDVDGVLNYHLRKRPFTDYPGNLARTCVGWLYYIINRTDAKIVISSSWRSLYDVEGFKKSMISEFKESAIETHISSKILDSIVGVTINGRKDLPMTRQDEVDHWMKVNDYKGNFAILDDHIILFDENNPDLFITWREEGLNEMVAHSVIYHLERQ